MHAGSLGSHIEGGFRRLAGRNVSDADYVSTIGISKKSNQGIPLAWVPYTELSLRPTQSPGSTPTGPNKWRIASELHPRSSGLKRGACFASPISPLLWNAATQQQSEGLTKKKYVPTSGAGFCLLCLLVLKARLGGGTNFLPLQMLEVRKHVFSRSGNEAAQRFRLCCHKHRSICHLVIQRSTSRDALLPDCIIFQRAVSQVI
jgi:hypothetical protein